MTIKKDRKKLAKFLRKNTNISFGDSFKVAKKIVKGDTTLRNVLYYFLPVIDYDKGPYCDLCNCYHGSVTFQGKLGPITLNQDTF